MMTIPPKVSNTKSLSAMGLVAALSALPGMAVAQAGGGGTLTVAADTEPRDLNPAIVASNGVFYISSKIVEPLAEMDYETGLRPLLATGWEGSEDGLSFTVSLREGVLSREEILSAL